MLEFLNKNKIQLSKSEQVYCYDIADNLVFKFGGFTSAGIQKSFDLICSAYRVLKLVNGKQHVDFLEDDTNKYMSIFKKKAKSFEKYGLEVVRFSLKSHTFQILFNEVSLNNVFSITLSIQE